MKKDELQNATIEELKSHELGVLEVARKSRFAEVTGSVDNPAKKRIVRRDIARIKTIRRQKELEKIVNKIEFPVHLKGKITFSSDIKQANLAGTLSNEEKNELLALSNDRIYNRTIMKMYKKSQSDKKRKA